MLFAGKFKLLCNLGVACVATASVPTSIVLINESGAGLLQKPLSVTKEALGGFFDQTLGQQTGNGLRSQYSDFGAKTQSNIAASPEKTREQLKTAEDAVKNAQITVKEKSQDINYYTFLAGDLIKSSLKYLPVLVRDSFMELMTPSATRNMSLFNVQKIVELAKSPKMPQALKALEKVAKDRASLVSNMTSRDADGIIQIIRELERGENGKENSKVSHFLETVKKNAEGIKSTDSFCNSTKLMIRVFVGDDEFIKKSKENIDTLSSLLEKSKEILNSLLGSSMSIDDLKSKLETLKNHPNLGDPCKEGSSSQ